MTSKLSSILVAAVAASLFAGQYSRADAAAFGANPQAFKQPANAITFGVQPQATGKTCRVHPPGNISPYLFANDNVSANVYEYCEDMPPNPTTPRLVFSSPTGFGGWGLAVSPDALGPAPARERLAVGTYGGAVNVFNVTNTGLLTQQKTLLLAVAGSSMRGNALGICFDGTGGLYATNYPFAEVDYFNHAAVVAGAAAPTTRYFTNTAGAAFYPTYLACDYDKLIIKGKRPPNWENIVMVDGIDGSGNADVGQLTATGAVTVLPGQVLGPVANSHFPGGMTIDRRDDLVVSDWYGGTLINFGPKEPWPLPVSVCKTGGTGTNTALLPIDFDDGQREIWGGNSFTAPASGNANAVSVPFPFQSTCGKRGESGGPTSTLQQALFVGIAVWPNTGV